MTHFQRMTEKASTVPFRCTHQDIALRFQQSSPTGGTLCSYQGQSTMHLQVETTQLGRHKAGEDLELRGICFSTSGDSAGNQISRVRLFRQSALDHQQQHVAAWQREKSREVPCHWYYYCSGATSRDDGDAAAATTTGGGSGSGRNGRSVKKADRRNARKSSSKNKNRKGRDGGNVDSSSLDIERHQLIAIRVRAEEGADMLMSNDRGAPLQLVLEISFVCPVRYGGDTSPSWSGLFHCFLSDGKSSNFIMTHFEPSFARTAFPCVDFYNQRATVRLSITVPLALIHSTQHQNGKGTIDPRCVYAISNASIQQENTVRAGIKQFVFHTTPMPMCSYHIAFALGHFQLEDETDYYSKINDDSMSLRVVYPNYGHSTNCDNPRGASIISPQEITEIVIQTLDTLEQFFEMPCEMPKLDIVIVPKLPLGGQENWGCIFLNESAQIRATTSSNKTNSKKKNQEQREAFVELLIHELAHMYVGNMTSFPFWVKEGLAQYFEKLIGDVILGRKHSSTTASSHATMDHLDMKYNHRTKTLEERLEDGSKNDSLSQEFSNLFNGVIYTQSFMFMKWRARQLGPELFRQRLKQLVSDNKYRYVDELNFLNAMDSIDRPIEQLDLK